MIKATKDTLDFLVKRGEEYLDILYPSINVHLGGVSMETDKEGISFGFNYKDEDAECGIAYGDCIIPIKELINYFGQSFGQTVDQS